MPLSFNANISHHLQHYISQKSIHPFSSDHKEALEPSPAVTARAHPGQVSHSETDMHSHSHSANLESAVKLTDACLRIVVGSWNTRRGATQTQGEHTNSVSCKY